MTSKQKVEEITKFTLVEIARTHIAQYPEHHEKIFKVLDIDDEGYCELQWINVQARNSVEYIHKDHLAISR